MRLLIITQYYLPESGAPQNRLSGLAVELIKQGHEVVVLTAMPNYPEMKIRDGYIGRWYMKEKVGPVEVYRAWIYTTLNRSIVSRLLNYFSFVFSSFITSFRIKGKFDYIMCESPPLFLGGTAVMVSKLKQARLIFNVSDLWPESAEKLGLVNNKILLKLSYRLEKWIYKHSKLVTGQTQGICKNIQQRFPAVPVHWLPNGVDSGRFDSSIKSNWRNECGFSSEQFIVLYAGIIGHAQGLDIMLNAAKELQSNTSIHFVLVGDGPEKKRLQELNLSMRLPNVKFIDQVDRNKMQLVLADVDAAVIPLKKLDIFKGAIPSKIFESLAMEVPILLGVEGEAKELFVDQGKCALFFEPENAMDLAHKIRKLQEDDALRKSLIESGKAFVYANFSRESLAKKLLDRLKEL